MHLYASVLENVVIVLQWDMTFVIHIPGVMVIVIITEKQVTDAHLIVQNVVLMLVHTVVNQDVLVMMIVHIVVIRQQRVAVLMMDVVIKQQHVAVLEMDVDIRHVVVILRTVQIVHVTEKYNMQLVLVIIIINV